MVTSSTVRPRKQRLNVLFRQAAFAIALLFIGLTSFNARATDFEILGSSTIYFPKSGFESVTLHKFAGHGSVHVNATVTGSSTITVLPASFDFDPYDTGAYSLVGVYFTDYSGDWDTAVITFADSNESHTLTVIGRDTNYLHPTKDYVIYGGDSSHIGWYNFNYGYANVELVNIDSSDINVSLTLVSGSGFSLDSTYLLIHPPIGNYYGEFLPLNHSHTGDEWDTAVVYLSCSSPAVQHDTIHVIIHDTTAHVSTAELREYGDNVGAITPGDTACVTMVVKNTGNINVTVTSASIQSNEWHFSSAPSFPVSLAVGDSLVFVACYSSTVWGEEGTTKIDVFYTDVDLNKGYMDGALFGNTKACLSVNPSDSVFYEDVIAGGFVEQDFYLKNNSTAAQTIKERIENYDSTYQFYFSPNPFPVTIAAGDSVLVHSYFAPTVAGHWDGADAFFTADSASPYCDGIFMGLVAENVLSGTDTSHMLLYPSQTEVLPMSSTSQVFTKTFTFTNNLSNTEKVTSVSFANGTHFSVVSPTSSSLPITLTTNETMNVEVQVDADTNGFWQDSLIIVTEHGAVAQAYKVEAVRGATQFVNSSASLVSSASLSVSPNPAQGPVAIQVHGAARVNIDVLDLLGRSIAHVSGVSQWSWPGATDAGVYFVRASGVDLSGRSFTTTSRVVMER
jgi:hypothetical protein